MKYTDLISKKIIFFIFVCISLFSGCAVRPEKFIDTSLLTHDARNTLHRKIFDKVWNLVNDKYYDPSFKGKDWRAIGERYRDEAFLAGDNKTLYRTINKMLGELGGSHLKAHMTGRFEDIYKDYQEPIAAGFMWQVFEDKAVVTQVFPESLAEKAGVRKGWLLTQIKDKSPFDEKNDEDKEAPLFRVPVLDIGKQESYTFIDQDENEHVITLLPEKGDETLLKWTINNESENYEPIFTRKTPEGYLYLLIKNFVSFKVSKAVKSRIYTEEETPGLILDLRYNNGGMEFRMKEVLEIFFQDDINIGTQIYRSGKSREEKINGKKPGFTKPIVILISASTFSAGEIFTHVMQYYHRGIVIGRQTKGYVQMSKQYNLPGGGIIFIPVVIYTGLDGMQLEGRGVTPEIIVPESDLATARTGHDPDMEVALKILSEKQAGIKR
jgi:carboxyl-terminal processing protease